jgi:hypothetical protein
MTGAESAMEDNIEQGSIARQEGVASEWYMCYCSSCNYNIMCLLRGFVVCLGSSNNQG